MENKTVSFENQFQSLRLLTLVAEVLVAYYLALLLNWLLAHLGLGNAFYLVIMIIWLICIFLFYRFTGAKKWFVQTRVCSFTKDAMVLSGGKKETALPYNQIRTASLQYQLLLGRNLARMTVKIKGKTVQLYSPDLPADFKLNQSPICEIFQELDHRCSHLDLYQKKAFGMGRTLYYLQSVKKR